MYGRDGLEFSRFVSFIDGGTVVALTLLAVSVLPVTRGLGKDEWERIFQGILQGTDATFVALVVAFVIVASFWLDQHLLYAHLKAIDRPFIVANLVYLFLITLTPAVAITLAEHRRDIYGSAFCLLWIVLLTLVSLWLPWLAARRGLFTHPSTSRTFIGNQMKLSALRAIVLIIAVATVRYLHPWVAFAILVPGLLGAEAWRSRMTWSRS